MAKMPFPPKMKEGSPREEAADKRQARRAGMPPGAYEKTGLDKARDAGKAPAKGKPPAFLKRK